MNSLLLSKYRNAITISAIAIVSLLMHWSIFQRDLIGIHIWRQSITQLNISNFYRGDNNILHPQVNVLDEKGKQQSPRTDFPLMQWMVAQLYRVFGESIFVTRVCMFLLGIGTITGFFLLVLAVFRQFRVAAIAAWAFNFSPVFYYYTLNPLPDNLALGLSIWSMYYYIKYRNDNQLVYSVLSAACIGLAVLIKLPYIVFGAIYAHGFLLSFSNRTNKSFAPVGNKISFALSYLVFLIPAVIWYYTVIPEWADDTVLKGFFSYEWQLSHALEILRYHYTTMFPQLLLNYAGVLLLFFGLVAFIVLRYYKKQLFWQLASGFLFVVFYYLYEFFLIDRVHDYYLMPFLPFLYLLVAAGVQLLLKYTSKAGYVIAFAAVMMPILTYRTVKENWTISRSYTNYDVIVHQQELKHAIPDNERCIFLNDVSQHIWPYLLDKKGYVFYVEQLPKEWIEDMILTKNVRYMYSDNRLVDENPENKKLFRSIIIQKGTIKLIELKTKDELTKMK